MRLEGWRRVQRMRPSFETVACKHIRPLQDEVGVCGSCTVIVRTDRTYMLRSAAQQRVSKHGRAEKLRPRGSLPVFVAAYLFQPVHGPAVDRFLDGDM